MHYCDVTDTTALMDLIQRIQPDEIYNLAAQSHVKVSFELPEYTANTDALWVLRILEAIRILWLTKKTKFYQASTSEMYGWMKHNMPETWYTEDSAFYPRSPYGVSKLFGHWITVNYREAYGIYACNGILFNHESPIRGETFVTRKITRAVSNIAQGYQQKLYLGNLDARRDWGHAKDYVEAMWLMLQQDKPEDFVIATGQTNSVREFVRMAFEEVGVELVFDGNDENEVGIVTASFHPDFPVQVGATVVAIDPRYYRPTEVDLLIGDPSNAMNKLGWQPKYNLKSLVAEMVASDMIQVKKEFILRSSMPSED